MRHTDRPISKPGQDLLGRGEFALQLAQAIDSFSNPADGFVMAIDGKWGEGKSSVVALVVRYLRHLEMERADDIFRSGDQSPLDLTGLERCAEICESVEWRLKSLASDPAQLQKWSKTYKWMNFNQWFEKPQDAREADRYWRLQTLVEKNPKTIVVNFSPWLIAGKTQLATALLSDLARSLGESAGEDVRTAFSNLLNRLSELAPFASAGANFAGASTLAPIASVTEKFTKTLSERLSRGPTLDDVRNQLKKVLRRLDGQQVLVVIDDLDRLTPKDALEAVALVKSLGDLPNVIYLLCYDAHTLDRLLTTALGVSGRSYLAKIVQYSVNLPRLRSRALSRILDAELSDILGELTPLQQRRLGQTWYLIFQHYLKTPRDVRRLVNAASVAVAAARDRLDPVDMLLIETMRVFEPEMYFWVRDHLDNITS